MNPQPHELAFYAITLAAVAFWLCAALYLRRVAAEVATANDDGSSTGDLTGSAEVTGHPGELSARAAAVLAKPTNLGFGPVKILEQTADRLTVEGLEHAGFRNLGRVEFRFRTTSSGRTRIDYTAVGPCRTWLLVMGRLFVVLGLAAILVGAALISTLVLSHPDPSVHWQSVQMVQSIHFLWPPFLFGALYRQTRRAIRASLDCLVHNLPHVSG